MAGNVFFKAMETAVGEANVSVPIEFVRSGALSGAVTIQYGVVGDSATAGADYSAMGGSIVIPDGAASVIVQIPILDDALPEGTEVLSVSIISVTGAELSAPRTHRISILDDETPAPPPPAEPPLVPTHDVTLAPALDGLSTPVRFVFAPGSTSTVLVAEKAGLLRSVNLETGAVNTLLDLRAQVNNATDRGLMDVVIHPDFASNPYVYLAYAVDPAETATRTGGAGRDGSGNRFAHVVRYTMDTSGPLPTIDPASAVILVGAGGQSLSDISGGGAENFTDPVYADRPASDRIFDSADRVVGGFKQDYLKIDSLSHAGGRLLFGPDGMLYVTTGDGTSFNYPDPHAADVQSLDSLSGKVLRIDPITGLGLADNPFAGEAESLADNRARIWQYGLRNPFSATFDEEGRLFLADVGWSTYEELNTGGPGTNFGWPYYEGGDGGVLLETPDYRNQPGADAIYAAVAAGTLHVTPAFRAFGHAAEVPGFRMQAIIMGALVPDNAAYPQSLQGHLLFSDYIGGALFSSDTNNRNDTGFLLDWPGERGPIHMAAGPDGQIYYLDMSAGEIGRLGIAERPEGGSARITIAASEATKLEGTGTTTPYAFTVTRSGVMNTAFSIGWSVAPAFEIGTSPAQAADFAGGILPSGTVSFTAGQSTATITVSLAADSANEPNERFDVVLGTPPSGVSLALANVGGVIFNDDAGLSALSIAADKGGASEGTGTSTTYSFTVTRTGGLDQPATAKWKAAGALDGGTVPAEATDFVGGTFPGGTVSFTAGQSTASIAVAIAGDGLGEYNERFGITLSNPSVSAIISKATATSIVFNDDVNLAIAPAALKLAEGNTGSTAFRFTVSRIGVGAGNTVAWDIAGAGATPATGADFIGGALPSGILTFGASDSSRTITIPVAGDTELESDEGFTVTLSNPSGFATITAATAPATILGDETSIAIAPLTVRQAEGSDGPTPFTFTVTRNGGLSQLQTVAWQAHGIAGPGTLAANAADFVGGAFPAGIATFAPGETEQQLTLQVAGDDRREFNERFAVTLSNPTGGATLASATAAALVLNDDTAISLITPGVSVAEGHGLWTSMSYYVERSGLTTGTSTVDWAVVPGGVAGTVPVNVADFYTGEGEMHGTLTFDSNSNVQDIVIAIAGDQLPEFNESFRLVLSNPTGATLGRSEALGVVYDDDRIAGTAASESLWGTVGADLFLIGLGHDTIAGLAGLDRFQFLPSALAPEAQNSFTFGDFSPAEGERLDLSRIDAIAGTGANNAFAFIGTAAFQGNAGELRWQDLGSQRLVQGDVNGDAVADLTLYLATPGPVQPGWFIL